MVDDRVPQVRRERPAGLSRREVEVLWLMARGLSNHDMARQLSVSGNTIKHHIQHIYDKIDVANRASATRWAITHRVSTG
jgi:ATP/maltotriose-dependent transcriptional regulator MalT